MSTFHLLAFAFLAATTLYGGLRVVTTPNVTHAAIFLGMSFLGVSGIYLLLQAEFLAAIQLLVYIGAILTVMIFAIMLSKLPEITDKEKKPFLRQVVSTRWGFVPLLVSVAFAAVVLYAYNRIGWPRQPAGELENSVPALGLEMFNTYVVPFEIASVLLTSALIGAIVVSRRREDI